MTLFFTHLCYNLILILLFILKPVILVSLNVAIIVKIFDSVAHRKLSNPHSTCSAHSGGPRESSNGASGSGNGNNQASNATKILLSVTFVYVLCTIPSRFELICCAFSVRYMLSTSLQYFQTSMAQAICKMKIIPISL